MKKRYKKDDIIDQKYFWKWYVPYEKKSLFLVTKKEWLRIKVFSKNKNKKWYKIKTTNFLSEWEKNGYVNSKTTFFILYRKYFFYPNPKRKKKKQVKSSQMFLSKDLLLCFSNKNEVFKGTKTFEK